VPVCWTFERTRVSHHTILIPNFCIRNLMCNHDKSLDYPESEAILANEISSAWCASGFYPHQLQIIWIAQLLLFSSTSENF
jgi:hypothetical protein